MEEMIRDIRISDAILDTAIVSINEYKISLESFGYDKNDYRGGYIRGLEKSIEAINKLKSKQG